MAETLHIVARITSLPDQVEDTRKVLIGALEPTRREPGCLRYDLFQDKQSPDTFIFLEEWTDEAALNVHLATPHIQSALAKLQGKLAAPVQIHRLRQVG